MTIYNTKEWFKAVVFIHKTDTFRKLVPYIIFMGIISWGIAYWELESLKLSDKSWVKNITTVHSLLGFVLSLLLVFRTNSAYDRWWEARKQWGALTNTSRNLAIKLNAYLPKEDTKNRNFYRKAIALYPQALFSFLRSDYSTFMLDDIQLPELNFNSKHGPNQVANLIYNNVNQLYKDKVISDAQFININQDITDLTNICGACERIKNTPIPYSYSSFIKKFIVLYVITLPFGFVFSMGYFVTLVVPFIFYILASLELIAEAIEDPFGTDADDLPIEKMAVNIKKHVGELI